MADPDPQKKIIALANARVPQETTELAGRIPQKMAELLAGRAPQEIPRMMCDLVQGAEVIMKSPEPQTGEAGGTPNTLGQTSEPTKKSGE